MASAQDNKTPDLAASSVNDGASTIGGSTLNDASSRAPLTGASDAAPDKHRKSWAKRLFSHGKKDKGEEGDDDDSGKNRKKSIADSGPYIFAFDPAQGKEVLQKNPHWPNEDSYKREKESEGQWAFGSMMGQQNKDFGGTVG